MSEREYGTLRDRCVHSPRCMTLDEHDARIASPVPTAPALDVDGAALEVLDILEAAMEQGDKGDTWPGVIDSIRVAIKDVGLAGLRERAALSPTTETPE